MSRNQDQDRTTKLLKIVIIQDLLYSGCVSQDMTVAGIKSYSVSEYDNFKSVIPYVTMNLLFNVMR